MMSEVEWHLVQICWSLAFGLVRGSRSGFEELERAEACGIY